MTDLEEPGALTGRAHPETSAAAAARALGRTGNARRRVLGALVNIGDLSDEELQFLLRMGPNTQRPRRVELVDRGFVVATAERRPTISGASSIVWTATDKGRAAIGVEW